MKVLQKEEWHTLYINKNIMFGTKEIFYKIASFEYSKTLGLFRIEFEEIEMISRPFKETKYKVLNVFWVSLTHEDLTLNGVIDLKKLDLGSSRKHQIKF